jgi:hypothetical protein
MQNLNLFCHNQSNFSFFFLLLLLLFSFLVFQKKQNPKHAATLSLKLILHGSLHGRKKGQNG